MLLPIPEAERLVAQMLEKNKVSPENARSVAIALVAAEAAGQSGHGLRRLAAYAAQANAGKVDGFVKPVASVSAAAALRVDAGHGFAYPALDLAVRELPALAAKSGIAIAAIHRSHHAGVMGLTVERFAERGLVALMFANTPAAMAPWGGKSPVYGTNPIAFAAPLPDDEPLVIDLAMSKVARGRIMAAHQKGNDIPGDWAFDVEGQPTTNPADALKGTMMPLGDAKGAALALMVEILAASLTGANHSFEATSLFDDRGNPPGLGQMIIAIDPAATGGAGTASRFALLVSTITADTDVRLPGRRSQQRRREALAKGIEIDDTMAALICS
ncbi:Ldh family oxidoreductase [Rhizobium binxianense]